MLFSVLTPVYDPEPDDLRRMVESVQAQTWQNWELCLADDCSENSVVQGLLDEFASADNRIKVCFRRERGHISAASNSAFGISSGDFVCLVDHDDLVEPYSLECAAACIRAVSGCDMLYSDEDSILPDGSSGTPYLKPAWSPDLLLSNMYTSHLTFYRRSRFEQAGGFRKGYEGSQDHDLALRISELAGRICHIPRVLYHWRCAPSSTALDLDNKAYAFDAGLRAVRDAVDRRGCPGRVEHVEGWPGHYRVRYDTPSLHVALVMYGGRSRMESAWSAFTRDGCARSGNLSVERHFFSSMTSAFSSDTLFDSSADLFVFLDCDAVRPLLPDVVRELASHAARPSSGAVSGLWLDPAGRVIHAGVMLDGTGRWHYSHYGFMADDPGYMGRLLDVANVLAVGRECFAVSAWKLREAGGLDVRCGEDAVLDLCLKLYAMGMYNVITPHARIETRTGCGGFEAGQVMADRVVNEGMDICQAGDPFGHPDIHYLDFVRRVF
jgi:glycosyltransferase involved in cell wall biosynthesis